MSALVTAALSKTFRNLSGRRFEAVADLNLDIAEGTVFGLLGPNGAGKTTTILMILGILHATSGRYSLFGAPMGNVQARRRVGYLPEKFQLPSFLTAQEYLHYQGRLFGLRRRALAARAAELLERVGLADRARTLIGGFSKGMQQRLGLAQALLNDPDLVILDEPTSALDPVGRMDVRGIIEEQRARGKTVLLNSHILSDVERVCDSVAILRLGRLERQGPISTLGDGGLELHARVGGWHEGLARQLGSLGRNLRVDISGDMADVRLDIPDEEAVPGVAAAIQAAGGRLYRLTPSRESLEDLFLRVMRGGE